MAFSLGTWILAFRTSHLVFVMYALRSLEKFRLSKIWFGRQARDCRSTPVALARPNILILRGNAWDRRTRGLAYTSRKQGWSLLTSVENPYLGRYPRKLESIDIEHYRLQRIPVDPSGQAAFGVRASRP